MTTEAVWDYAIGMIKVDGFEPTEDFKKYIEPAKISPSYPLKFLKNY